MKKNDFNQSAKPDGAVATGGEGEFWRTPFNESLLHLADLFSLIVQPAGPPKAGQGKSGDEEIDFSGAASGRDFRLARDVIRRLATQRNAY